MGRRETPIDVLRGWFIVSMTVGHLAAGSIAERAVHAGVWIDGAIGFVACSGLVLALVYRRVHDRTGQLPYAKALRRARLLWLIHVAVATLALAVASVSTRFDDVADPVGVSGWARSLWLVATLRLPAAHLDILPMYVLFLLGAVPALWLLSRSRAWLLLSVSAAVFAVAYTVPDAVTPDGVHFVWAAWQLPFVLGLVVGWYWEERGLAEKVRSRTGIAVAVVLTGTCLVLAQAFGRFGVLEGTRTDQLLGQTFGKFELGPARVVFAFAAIALGYAAVSALLHVGPLQWVWGWLSLLGSRSLDAFVIQCVAVILLPALLAYPTSSLTAMLVVLLTLLAQTAWILARRRGLLPGLRTGTDVPTRPLSRLSRPASPPPAAARPPAPRR